MWTQSFRVNFDSYTQVYGIYMCIHIVFVARSSNITSLCIGEKRMNIIHDKLTLSKIKIKDKNERWRKQIHKMHSQTDSVKFNQVDGILYLPFKDLK